MSDRPWLPEHPVDADLATRLVRAQFPQLPACEPVHEGRGFDNDVWRFGAVVFRFPRRAMAIPALVAEIEALPYLASHLPVPLPTPELHGTPVPEFPYPFYGHRFLPGTTADRARLAGAARAALAPELGRLLRMLHALDPAEAARHGVPPDAFRSDLAGRSAKGLERLGGLAATPWAHVAPAMRRLLADPPAPTQEPPVVLHGDLYARHLVLDAAHRLAGVIDWGDLCLGDRAVDLALAYTFLPAPSRDAFWEAYGGVDPATRARARFLAAARHGLHLALYAADVGDTDLAWEVDRIFRHLFEPEGRVSSRGDHGM